MERLMDDLVTDNVALAKRAWSWLDTDRDWTTGAMAELQQLYFELLDQDAVLIVDRPENATVYQEPIRGKQALIDMYRTAPCWLEDNCLERPLEFIGSGDLVLVLGSERFTVKEDRHTRRNKEFVIVMDFRDGRIARLVQFQGMPEWPTTTEARSSIVLAKKTLSDWISRGSECGHERLRAIVDLLADDVVLKVATPEPVHELRGKRPVRDYYATLTSHLIEANVQLTTLPTSVGNGGRVVLLGTMNRQSEFKDSTTGTRDFALIIDFRDKHIARMVSYCQ